MKRLATAAFAATTALAMIVAPTYAADGTSSSSKYYSECVKDMKEGEKLWAERGYTKEEVRGFYREAMKEEYGTVGSTASSYCLGEMTHDDYAGEDYKAGTIAFLTLVPLGIVALLGVAAAASGVIPGVTLPALPSM